MCKHSQQTQYQSSGSPRLTAYPGAIIALRYQENGHVTLPQNQKGKPADRGTVRIYGTAHPSPNEAFLNVFGQWNEMGDGGDRRGQLVASQAFDDGRCYQVNSGDISKSRQAQYAHPASDLTGADLWCQNNIRLPSDIAVSSTYTLYWSWDWATVAGVDPALPEGKAEVYTTCIDLDIVAKPGSKRLLKDRQAPSPSPSPASGNLNSAAIPAYMSSLTASPAPASASPVVSAKPTPQSQPSSHVAADLKSTTNGGVASYIESVVSAAIVAAQIPKTVTVIESAVSPGTTAVAAAQSAATPASYSAPPPANYAPSSTLPAASMPPPKSLAINAPILSGTATPIAASPAPQSSLTPVIASGAPQNGTTAANGQRGCNACKAKRQSRIFGKNSVGN